MADWMTGLVGIAGIATTFFAGSREARERAKAHKEETERLRIERIYAAYNAVLEYDGANFVINVPPHERLDIEVYKTHVRPKLFGEFHVIDDDVRAQLHQLDSTIAHLGVMWENDEESTDEEYNAATQYYQLIQLIHKHYNEH